jgi:hypothetical protein
VVTTKVAAALDSALGEGAHVASVAGAPPATMPPRSVGARRAQIAAIGSLVALPLLVYALPALFGHPVVPGDDLTQNLPLRQLVGHDLAAGHLPVFNPYIWGGAPLLAGWNAGAAYPLSWLFAVLPGDAAWTLNLVAAAVTAGVGCYAFLRASRLGQLASWAGAMTYAFGGGMVAQIPHVGLVIGMSWLPVALLAVLRLTDSGAPGDWRRLSRWTAVLAAAVGLVLLSGEPRAVTDAAAVLLLYALWRLVRLIRGATPARSWAGACAAVLSGAVLGIGLGAVQLLPGLAAVATSQRAHVTTFLFSAGSLPVRWLALLGVPDLLGGSGSFGQPVFFAHYNLTEVTGYVGLLPLAGAFALFGKLGTRRSRQPFPDWIVWEIIAGAGLLLALGNNTPVWRLLFHIPLIGGQRLQSRGILVAGLAFSVLLAYWLDGWTRGAGADGQPGTTPAEAARGGRPGRGERLLGAIPMVAVCGILAAALVAGRSFLEWMGVGARTAAAHATALRPWLLPSLALALIAMALVVGGWKLAPRTRAATGAAFIAVDLVLFSVATVVAVGTPAVQRATPTPPTATTEGTVPVSDSNAPGVAASKIRPIAELHLPGRFAVYDPGLLYPAQLATLGVPDANALAGTWSVQGYGSIVDGRYATATGVHGVSGTGQDVFAPRAAADGTFDALSTAAVLAPSQYLITPSGRGPSAPSVAGTRTVGSGARASWFFGAAIPVRSATVAIRRSSVSGTAAALLRLRMGLLTARGSVDWARVQAPRGVGTGTPASGTTWTATWKSPVRAVGLVVESSGRPVLEPPHIWVGGGRTYAVDGVMQSALVAPGWRYDGQDGAFAVFVDHRSKPALTLRALPGGSIGGAAVHRVAGPSLAPTSARVTSSHGVEVVRAVTAIPGWTASWTPLRGGGGVAGAPQPLAVHRLGVVQVVRAPGGEGIITWTYHAPLLRAGESLSAAALVLLFLLVLSAVGTRRPRWSRPPT